MNFNLTIIIKECIIQIKNGDRNKAVEKLYYALNFSLRYRALKYFSNEQDIEDAIQEFWEHIVEYCSKIKALDNGRAYLLKCFENQCLMTLRREKKHKEVLSLDQQFMLLDKQVWGVESDSLDTNMAIDHALSQLNELEKQLILSVDFQGYTIRAVAKQLNISKSKASRIHSEALKKMRKDFET